MRVLFFLGCFCLTCALRGETSESLTEESQIELLVNATKASLESLLQLQDRLTAFKEQETLCINGNDDPDALYALSERALALVSSIHENHVEPYFRSAFIEELERLKKTAQSKNIPSLLSP